MTSETVTEEKETATEVAEDLVDQTQEQEPQEESQEQETEQQKEEHVPVSAHVAERKRRQEAEQRAKWLEEQLQNSQQSSQPKKQVDNSDDLLTVGQLNSNFGELKRQVAEEMWLEDNSEKVDIIKNDLPELLKNPKHKWLAESIPNAQNRLKRAWQIYEMLKTPEVRKSAPAPNRDNTPKSPQSVGKTNKLSLADRLMSMSDQELEDWRLSQKRKVR